MESKTVDNESCEILSPIFTTGAFLHPVRVMNRFGQTVWTWGVSEFIDDSYYDGETFNPPESAVSLEELMNNTTAHDDVPGND